MTTNDECSMATRVSLLERLKDWGQQTAWREFAHNYGPLIRNVARKAGLNHAEADEVAQEVMIAVARKIGEFRHAGNAGSFRAWLYQQTRWRVVDQFRARERETIRSQGADQSSTERELPTHLNNPPSEGANSDVLTEGGNAPRPQVDAGFQQLWDGEWTNHVYRAALARVKGLISARQFQLFDLYVLQGLSVNEAARAAGASLAAVYMAKSRVGRLLKHEIRAVSTIELDR